MGLGLKDSAPGFDPMAAVESYEDEDYTETEQY